MKITIGYITAREEPHLEWLIAGIEKQASKKDEIELIVVDALGRSASAIGFRAIKPIKKLIETRPKPTIWQGPHRITPRDFFANANARNTALVLCSTSYICFLDDRCRLEAGWLEQVRRGERKRESVICGPYDKHEDWGVSLDHRRQRKPRGLKNCSGAWCFGGNFALPLDWALEINGCEEGCDPVGLEDCVFGHMLANAGRRIDFVIEMSVQQDRRGFVHPLNFPRQDKGQSPNDKSHALEDRFRGRKRTEFTPDLKALRERRARGGSFPIPDPKSDPRDWYDGSSIRDAGMTREELIARAQGRAEVLGDGRLREEVSRGTAVSVTGRAAPATAPIGSPALPLAPTTVKASKEPESAAPVIDKLGETQRR
jgi:glycosyltransferase involved in cell wall biosynthesis